MDILALDLSKKSTGWARWSQDQPRPAYGSWRLGSEFTPPGKVFLNLHQNLHEQFMLGKPDIVIYEQPIALNGFNANSSADLHFLAVGMAAHVDSYCEAKCVARVRSVNVTTWRRSFIGPMKRGTKTKQLKDYSIERCQHFGFAPKTDDEADAIGILDHMIGLEGIIPPWRRDCVLMPAFMGKRA